MKPLEKVKGFFQFEHHVWAANFLSVMAIFSQLASVMTTHEVKGLSLTTWIMFVYIQAVFSVLGYKTKNNALFMGQLLCAFFSSGIVIYILAYR